jgi:archaellin
VKTSTINNPANAKGKRQMKFYKIASAAITLLLSINVNASLISTLQSFDNTARLIAGDQSNSTIHDWATASAFHVGAENITIEGMTAVFNSTTADTSRYLEIGVYESTGSHGIDLAPGTLIGSFDTSTIYSSDTRLSLDLTAYSSFGLQANTDYLLVWNAQPGAPFLGLKRGGTSEQMINDGIAGIFTGEIMSSQDGGSSWYSTNQYGFDFTSLNGTVSANAATTANGTVSSIPLPAAAWLFGSGLLGLIGISGRKKAS